MGVVMTFAAGRLMVLTLWCPSGIKRQTRRKFGCSRFPQAHLPGKLRPVRITTSFRANSLLMATGLLFRQCGTSPTDENSSIFVVPAHGGKWIRITDGRQWDDKPRWSPDGKSIYFISARRGFYNVWGNRFDPVNGRVVGNPFQVTDFDNPALMVPPYIPDVGLSIARGRLAVTVSQSSGSIWVLNNVDESVGR